MTPRLTIRGAAEERTIEQIRRCMESGNAAAGALCADSHVGYSMPIGGVVGYRDHISPSGVGYDIGCGNMAVKTAIRSIDIDRELPGIMDEIQRRVSFGMGRNNDEPVDHEVLDHIGQAAFEPQRKLQQSAYRQLGTVGAGNHYVDLFLDDEEDRVWVGVHFGSRGFGHKTASGFLALAQGKAFDEHAADGEMDSPPVLFATDSELGQAYIEAMGLAGEYAHAGREVVIAKVLEILGSPAVLHSVHNHHNFAWRETHGGEDLWVVRKGCTPAFPGQEGFVGATMGETSVILEGVASEAGEGLLRSTVHGAGRLMSRTRAAGKVKRRKRYACMDRDCKRVFELDGISAHRAAPKTGVCPDHPTARIRKVWVSEQIRPGEIDWDAALGDLKAKQIELRGGAADEAPLAYKRLEEVLAAHSDTIVIKHRLRPIGVAMAGGDVVDKYKD